MRCSDCLARVLRHHLCRVSLAGICLQETKTRFEVLSISRAFLAVACLVMVENKPRMPSERENRDVPPAAYLLAISITEIGIRYRERPHKGSSGSPFSTSSVAFLPNAGRELMLKAPLLRFVKPSRLFSSRLVSIRVGLPIALSVWRLNRLHISIYEAPEPRDEALLRLRSRRLLVGYADVRKRKQMYTSTSGNVLFIDLRYLLCRFCHVMSCPPI